VPCTSTRNRSPKALKKHRMRFQTADGDAPGITPLGEVRPVNNRDRSITEQTQAVARGPGVSGGRDSLGALLRRPGPTRPTTRAGALPHARSDPPNRFSLACVAGLTGVLNDRGDPPGLPLVAVVAETIGGHVGFLVEWDPCPRTRRPHNGALASRSATRESAQVCWIRHRGADETAAGDDL
jgi:hypothetical protein